MTTTQLSLTDTPKGPAFSPRAQSVAMETGLLSLERIVADLEARERAKRNPARSDFNVFARGLLRDRRGNTLPFDAFSALLVDALIHCTQARRHFGLMGPPSIGKSTLIRGFLAWLAGRDPASSTVVVSAESKIAQRQVAEVRKLVLSPFFREVFPEVQPDIHRGERKAKSGAEELQGWTKKEFYFLVPGRQSPDPAFAADAADPKSEARRVDVLFADDVMSRNVAESKALKTTLIDAFRRTWLDGRLAEDGTAIVTHNCWTKDDLLHVLREDRRFLHMWVGVEDDCERLFARFWNVDGSEPFLAGLAKYEATEIPPRDGADFELSLPLPNRRFMVFRNGEKEPRESFTPAALRKVRDAQPASFRGLFRLIAAAPEDLMFPSWPTRTKRGATLAELLRVRCIGGVPTLTDIDRMRFLVAAGVDFSSSKRKGTCLTIIAAERNTGNIVPMVHRRFSGAKVLDQLLDAIQGVWMLGVHPAAIVVENNAVQDLLADTLRMLSQKSQFDWWGRIVPFTTGANKSDPEMGLPAIDPEIASGRYVFPERWGAPEGSRVALDWAALETDFADCARFLKPNSTPDGVMSWWFARDWLTRHWAFGGVGKTESVLTNKDEEEAGGGLRNF